MSIRNAAKAIVIYENKILLNKCKDKNDLIYYVLPGGGQNQYETIKEAIVRECLEETGYTVIPVRFVALYEEIYINEEIRINSPDYSHRIYHIFICKIKNKDTKISTEKDNMQINSEWIDLDSLSHIRFLPKKISKNLKKILNTKEELFFGSEYIDLNDI